MKNVNLKFPIEQFNDLEIDDAYVEVKDIRKGDVIFECEKGENHLLQAVSDALPTGHGWVCKVQDALGYEYEIFVSGNTKSIYTPRLYRIPQYLQHEESRFYYEVA